MKQYKVVIQVKTELITFNSVEAKSSEEVGRKAMEIHLKLHDDIEGSVIISITRK